MLCNFGAGEVGVASPRYLAAVNGNWPAEWNPLPAHAPSGRVGDLYAATAGGGVLRHDGDQWTALAARQKWGVVVTAILLRPFGRRGLMITMRRALGVPATAAAASPQATALGAFTLLVHRHFRPRLDRLPLFSTQALTAVDVPMLTIVGGRDAMVDSYQTKQRLERAGKSVRLLPQAGHLLPDQTQPILDFLGDVEPRAEHIGPLWAGGLDVDEHIQMLCRNECQGEDRRQG